MPGFIAGECTTQRPGVMLLPTLASATHCDAAVSINGFASKLLETAKRHVEQNARKYVHNTSTRKQAVRRLQSCVRTGSDGVGVRRQTLGESPRAHRRLLNFSKRRHSGWTFCLLIDLARATMQGMLAEKTL